MKKYITMSENIYYADDVAIDNRTIIYNNYNEADAQSLLYIYENSTSKIKKYENFYLRWVFGKLDKQSFENITRKLNTYKKVHPEYFL